MKRIALIIISIIVVTLSIGVFTACTKEKFTVTYDHGYDGKVEKIQVEKGGTLPDVPAPTRHSYIFSEWIMEGNPDFDYKNYKVTSDITLKATWEDGLNVKIIINEQESDYVEIQVKQGSTLPQDIEETLRYDRDNYKLLGFNEYTRDKELIPFDLSTTIENDIEIVAELMSKGLEIRVDEDHCTVVDYDRKAYKHRVIIPTYYEGKKVTRIERAEVTEDNRVGVFEDCTNLAGITLPRYLEYIDRHTFRCSSDLGNVWIPYTTNEIGDHAFSAQGSTPTLNAIIFEDNSNLKTLSRGIFKDQINLRNIKFGEGLEKIESFAFESCYALKYINLPTSLKEIQKYSFINCINIEEIYIYENVTMIEAEAFSGCDNEMRLYTKADRVNPYDTSWNKSDNGFVYPTTYNFRSVKLDLKGGKIPNFNPANNAILGSYYDNVRLSYIPTLNGKKFAYYYVIINGIEVQVTDSEACITKLEDVQDGMTLYAKYI